MAAQWQPHRLKALTRAQCSMLYFSLSDNSLSRYLVLSIEPSPSLEARLEPETYHTVLDAELSRFRDHKDDLQRMYVTLVVEISDH